MNAHEKAVRHWYQHPAYADSQEVADGDSEDLAYTVSILRLLKVIDAEREEVATLTASLAAETEAREVAERELATVRERLAMAWAFNAGGEWLDRSHIQVRRAGPAGTYWFLVRNGSAGGDGAWLQRDGSWGGREPQPFPDADGAFAELAKIRAALSKAP